MALSATENTGPEYAYVCSGAVARCDKGTLPSQFVVPVRSVSLNGQPMANANDTNPLLNNLNFGGCSLTQKPCLLTCHPLQWLNVKLDVEVAGAPALLECSKLPCALGGVITFIQPGQLA